MAPVVSQVESGLSPAETPTPEPVPVSGGKNHTYGQILKSSATVGGSAVVNIGIGIIRTKAMALLLGPAGVGLMGLYFSILNLAQSVAGLGINSSGVRQIADAAGSGDAKRIGRTAAVLRRTAIGLGLAGAVLLVLFSKPISVLTFGNDRHTGAVAALSIALFLICVSGGQAALIQGLRRISDLARMGIWAGFFGLIITIPLIFFFREKGIVPSLIAGAGVMVLVARWYTGRIQVQAEPLTVAEWKQETGALLKLGLAFAASAVLTMGAAYAIRLIVLRKIGFEAAGLYQSAWTLGGLYVGFILQAMTADFYPRLTAAAGDNPECNRLVNEQAHIGLLLAGPGVMATMTFAPLVIALFYSSKFAAAVEPLRWICLGMCLRVVAWPMGFIILAKGIQTIFFWTEVAATAVHIGLALVLVSHLGLIGATMAFAGLYVWHGILIYVIVRQLTGFRWSEANRRTGLLFLFLIGMVFLGFHRLPFSIATVLGGAAALGAGIYSIRALVRLVGMDRLPRFGRQLLVILRIAPAGVA